MTAKLTKYPVTSPSGAVYRVDVEEYHAITAYVSVRVFIDRGRKLFRWKCVNNADVAYWRMREKFGGDYIAFAKAAVLEYEEMLAQERKHIESLRQFNEWDGVIR